MYGFMTMVEASQKGTERALSIEEEHRKHAYPEICSEDCPHKTCGYHTEANYGKPCFMRFEQYKTPPQPQSDPLARTPLLRQIEEEVTKAFQPLEERLRKIENREKQATIERSFAFNGKRTRVDTGTNQERIAN